MSAYYIMYNISHYAKPKVLYICTCRIDLIQVYAAAIFLSDINKGINVSISLINTPLQALDVHSVKGNQDTLLSSAIDCHNLMRLIISLFIALYAISNQHGVIG